MNDASPLEPLRAIAAILDQLGLPWCLGGSLASSFFGEPRATRDIDRIVRGDSAFDVSEFSRREVVLIDPGARISVPIKSAEDSILRKLLWFPEGGSVSDQQWRDITGSRAVSDARE